MFHCQIYSKEFLDEDSSWSVTPTTSLLQQIHSIPGQSSIRWIASIRVGGQEHKIALGSPTQSDENALYFPTWFLDGMSIEADGHERIVRFEPSETIPRAQRLHFQTVGIIPDWIDIVSILEEPLSQLGVLKKGQMLPVPVIENAMLILDVYDPEEEYVFMDGNNITLEVEPDESVLEAQRLEAESARVEAEAEATRLEAEAAAQVQVQQTPPIRGKFTPFQGKGYVLGGR
jgi:hypothetical protein